MGKKTIILAIMTAVTTIAFSQEKAEISMEADIVNQYIWRGQDLGNLSLQPTLCIDYKGLSLSAWGNVGISEPADTKEIDLTLAYSVGGFNIGITDYWLSTGPDHQNRYFKYDAHGTNHVFEANIGYDFGVAALQWYTNFAGNDGANNSGNRAYSSYVELSVPFSYKEIEWKATAGAVPFATDYYETSCFAVTDLSLKGTYKIHAGKQLSIPIFAGITANPCTQKAYLLFGITLQPQF